MPRVRFSKMQACGNDFVVLDAIADEWLLDLPSARETASRLCDRRFGVGGDGVLMLVSPAAVGAEGAEGPGGVRIGLVVLVTNADGSAPGMCVNGLRCAARAAVEAGHVRPDEHGRIGVRIGGLDLAVSVFAEGGVFEGASVHLPEWSVEPAAAGMSTEGLEPAGDHAWLLGGAELGDRAVAATPVFVGNPHAVVFLEEGAEPSEAVFALGPTIEGHPAFGRRANAQFVRAVGRDRAVLATWERGVGMTLGCGSGAAAAAAAGLARGVLGPNCVVRMAGGEVVTRVDRAAGTVSVTGPAHRVFEGEADPAEVRAGAS